MFAFPEDNGCRTLGISILSRTPSFSPHVPHRLSDHGGKRTGRGPFLYSPFPTSHILARDSTSSRARVTARKISPEHTNPNDAAKSVLRTRSWSSRGTTARTARNAAAVP